ncbi:hypothetical protein M422DRAFT_66561 [Sphaerobolus stellatus SS14]|nr:hypothetical protein M422DRAFT_66561 [Sphaerobolus stellatus SS14]
MRHPEFPILSFLCVPLVLSSLPSHIRGGNVPTISLVVWLTTMSIIRGVNSIAWAGNVDAKLLVWCDITTKITIGFVFAVPASALCILRHLESVASTRYVTSGQNDKRRRQIFDAVMCFGLPVIFMALHYVVQGHRFDVAEDLGCAPAVYISIPAVFILWVPPLMISTISMVYAIFVLRHFLRHRISFATHLRNSQSAISPSRYFRLMALAIVEITWDTGTNIYILYYNIIGGLRPWTTWTNVHSNFSRVGRFPNFLVPIDVIHNFIFQWWIIPISCIFFFLFFGTGEEAMRNYRAGIAWISLHVFRRSESKENGILPIHSISQAPFSPKCTTDCGETSKSSISYKKPWDEISLASIELTDDAQSIAPSYKENSAEPAYKESNSPAPSGLAINDSTTLPQRYSLPIDYIVISDILLDTHRNSWPLDQRDSCLSSTPRSSLTLTAVTVEDSTPPSRRNSTESPNDREGKPFSFS